VWTLAVIWMERFIDTMPDMEKELLLQYHDHMTKIQQRTLTKVIGFPLF